MTNIEEIRKNAEILLDKLSRNGGISTSEKGLILISYIGGSCMIGDIDPNIQREMTVEFLGLVS